MIKFEDIFPVGDEKIKYPLLDSFVSWLIEDSINLNDREATLTALETNLNDIASATIMTQIEKLQEQLKEAQSKIAVLQLDNGNTIIMTPEEK